MIKWFRDRGIQVGHAWGMTEMSPIGTVGSPPRGWDEMSDEEQVDYICQAGPVAVRRRAAHRRRRRQCAAARRRELGPAADPRAIGWSSATSRRTRTRSTTDQWFDTGDVAAIHPDGTLQITDRSKDVIKSGGEWISSIELENAAVGCPGVAEAAAIGIAHPKWDERPLLVCVASRGQRRLRGQGSRHPDRPGRQMVAARRDRVRRRTAAHGHRQAEQEDLREQFRDYRFADAEAMVGRD